MSTALVAKISSNAVSLFGLLTLRRQGVVGEVLGDVPLEALRVAARQHPIISTKDGYDETARARGRTQLLRSLLLHSARGVWQGPPLSSPCRALPDGGREGSDGKRPVDKARGVGEAHGAEGDGGGHGGRVQSHVREHRPQPRGGLCDVVRGLDTAQGLQRSGALHERKVHRVCEGSVRRGKHACDGEEGERGVGELRARASEAGRRQLFTGLGLLRALMAAPQKHPRREGDPPSAIRLEPEAKERREAQRATLRHKGVKVAREGRDHGGHVRADGEGRPDGPQVDESRRVVVDVVEHLVT